MKLIKIEKKFKKLFELYLIKHKIYEQPIKKNLPDVSLTKTILNFKKALYLIFKYHKNNKKILFLGVPQNIKTQLNIKTRHIAIPDVVSAQQFDLKNRIKESDSILLPGLHNNPELVVVFNQNNNKYQAIIKESLKFKIPLINFSAETSVRYWGQFYPVSNNNSSLSSKHMNNIFFTVINAVLLKKRS